MADVIGQATRHVTPIVALDVSDAHAAHAMVEQLGDSCDFYKVGLELFTACGPSIVDWLREQQKRVFVDLKLHDIPNTVRKAARSVAARGADLLTVHASGGIEMMRAAVDGAADGSADRGAAAFNGCAILGVTILTSLDSEAAGRAWGRGPIDVQREVIRLASETVASTAQGLVCSGHEAASVRSVFGERLGLLIPGIRLAGGEAHDQRRVMSPSEAARAGARWIVLGRAVTAAADPVSEMRRVNEDLAATHSV